MRSATSRKAVGFAADNGSMYVFSIPVTDLLVGSGASVRITVALLPPKPNEFKQA